MGKCVSAPFLKAVGLMFIKKKLDKKEDDEVRRHGRTEEGKPGVVAPQWNLKMMTSYAISVQKNLNLI